MIRDTTRWDRPVASVRDGRGPERTDTQTPDPEFRPRPVGFVLPDQSPEQEEP